MRRARHAAAPIHFARGSHSCIMGGSRPGACRSQDWLLPLCIRGELASRAVHALTYSVRLCLTHCSFPTLLANWLLLATPFRCSARASSGACQAVSSRHLTPVWRPNCTETLKMLADAIHLSHYEQTVMTVGNSMQLQSRAPRRRPKGSQKQHIVARYACCMQSTASDSLSAELTCIAPTKSGTSENQTHPRRKPD